MFDQFGRNILEFNEATRLERRWEIFAGSRAIATYANATTYWNHPDPLGTVRLRTQVNGTEYQRCANLPFGDASNCSNTTYDPTSFTGMEQDAETQLNHTWFRQQSPAMGRWMTPDPAGLAAADLSNPQSLNRYAYVLNNPVNLGDPLGLDPHSGVCLTLSGDKIPCTASNPDAGPPSTCFMNPFLCWGGTSYADFLASFLNGFSAPGSGSGPGNTTSSNLGPVHPSYGRTFACSTDAAGAMQQVEADFSQFANFSGSFGWQNAYADVNFAAGPVAPGRTIGISEKNYVLWDGRLPLDIKNIDVSVRVASSSATTFSFATNPGHVLFPATITFTAANAGNGAISFGVQVSGSFASLSDRLLYHLAGGHDLENKIWNHLIDAVQQKACAKQ